MSKASSKRPRRSPAPRRGARAGHAHTEEPEELAGLEAAYTPAFSDFPVPAEVTRAFSSWAASRDDGGEGGFTLGRVVRLDRGYPLVACAQGAFRAEHAVALVKGDDLRAAVGDWVALRLPRAHDKALIECVLPRLGALSRWDGSSRGERQVLAANVDTLLVVQPLSSRPVGVDRIARSLVLACEGGARCAVVLTKADRSSDGESLAADVARVRAAVGPAVEVAAVSCLEGTGLEAARSLVAPGTCALLLGESGAGKSTLVNALLGAEVLGVGAVRARDDQGRHTTVARRMLKVPGAGVLVDAPGLRSLPLLDEERGLALAYPEIARLEPQCRFRDCSHGAEPGCAVRAGVAAGEVEAPRLEQYRALEAEMRANRLRLDPSARSSITR